MKTRLLLIALLATSCIGGAAVSQEAVTGVADPDSLFTSPDPHLNTNKQAAYHIMKTIGGESLEFGGQMADCAISPAQPQRCFGRDPVVKFFMSHTQNHRPFPNI